VTMTTHCAFGLVLAVLVATCDALALPRVPMRASTSRAQAATPRMLFGGGGGGEGG